MPRHHNRASALFAALLLTTTGALTLVVSNEAEAKSKKYKTTQTPPSAGGGCRATKESSQNSGKVGTYKEDPPGSGKFVCQGNTGSTHWESVCGGKPDQCESVSPALVD